jgi:outer membrane protein assembly factor BamD (BamD/ComL family)
MSRVGKGLTLVLVLFAPACRSLSRDFNQALPGIFRSEPGAEEYERLAVLKRGRVEATPEEVALRKERYGAAKATYAEGNYGDAADLFEDFLDEFPGTEFDEEGRFLWGESHYKDGDFGAAYAAFKSFTTNYPVSTYGPTVEERVYDVGRDYLDGNQSAFFGIFTNRGKGVEILDYLVETYPNADRADDAKWLVARYRLDDEDWEKAAPQFDFLVKQYPQSEWAPASKWFSAYCRYRRVKGERYDPLLIEESRKRFVEYLAENPQGEWRAQAEEIVAELDLTAAERTLNIGLWYLDQDKPYSARFYFLRVTKLWPGSNAAKRAEALYAEVAGAEPETPEEELRLAEERAARAAAAPESAPASRESK